MTLTKPYLTLITNFALAVTGAILAYLTDWIILIPILFGFGIPLVNLNKPLLQKAGLTLAIVIISVVIFVGTIIAALSLDFDEYVFPGVLVGTAGVLILGINRALIETVTMNTRTVVLTFLLSGTSLPLWTVLTENILPSLAAIDIIRQFGVMVFWMTLTTIGIITGIKEKQLTAYNNKG
jgi:hypothetical protein